MKKVLFWETRELSDSLAIMYGIMHPDIDIVSVVTGYGNVTQEKATSNAAYLLQMAGREDIPVINGAKSLYPEMLQRIIQKFMGQTV